MGHEGNHEIFDVFLSLCNIVIAVLALIFLRSLFQLYKDEDLDELKEEINTPSDNVSFSYQSVTQSKESRYVLWFSMAGIACICLAGLFGAIFYSETYFTYQSTTTTAAFEWLHELFWNLGEIHSKT